VVYDAQNPAMYCMGTLSTNGFKAFTRQAKDRRQLNCVPDRTNQSHEILLPVLIEQLRQVERPGGLFSASEAWKNDWDAFCHAKRRQKRWTMVCLLLQPGVRGQFANRLYYARPLR
jgi:hypothetical protein